MRFLAMSALLILFGSTLVRGEEPTPSTFASQVAPILRKYCVGCHNDVDREGDFSLEGQTPWKEGTSHGPLVKPGDAASSLLIRLIAGETKPTMPPKGEARPTVEEVAVLRSWIDRGALDPVIPTVNRLTLNVPKIMARGNTRPITALDVSADGQRRAVGRYGVVEIHEAGNAQPHVTLTDLPGKVNAVHFTKDVTQLVTASGVVGVGGVASIWNAADGSLIRKFEGHRDLLFDAELSPDGKILATCGYDRTIQLWNADDGTVLKTLTGHNGAVYDVAFSPDGRFLVSSSGDDTCKVWRVSDGARMDTLTQPLKEEYACRFSPDGQKIVAAGADNSIRVWDFLSQDEPKINPMVLARFAHEGSITRIAFTPDGTRLVTASEDRTIKVWNTADYSELQHWTGESDVVSALAIFGDGRKVVVGRIDGTMATYDLPDPRQSLPSVDRVSELAISTQSSLPTPALASENEPNNTPTQANLVAVPAVIQGKIAERSDVDLIRFHARAAEAWVIEVEAARTGSKLDSFVEVLDDQGHRLERVLLQATRDSYFTFRGKNDSMANDFRLFNWDEMHLDEYLYANGEVVKLWLYPRGPDSGFLVYPGEGQRWGYFDTTPLAHALGEPCYVVEAHPPGAKLVPNGLPTFSLAYENDDDARRELGKDSRLTFTSPHDGDYLVKVRDVRGSGGIDHPYKLTIRPQQPDFRVTLNPLKAAINPGGAQEFQAKLTRVDGFEDSVQIDLSNLPPGFHASSPLTIEAGQIEAFGVVWADREAVAPTKTALEAIRVRASAKIHGQEKEQIVPFPGQISLAAHPALQLMIEPTPETVAMTQRLPDGTLEVAIHPGQTLMLKVRAERNGLIGPIPFGNEGCGRNLPFGAIVDNIGLSGLLITKDETERTFFVTADRVTKQQLRPFHLNTTAAGGQSSTPVLLRVR